MAIDLIIKDGNEQRNSQDGNGVILQAEDWDALVKSHDALCEMIDVMLDSQDCNGHIGCKTVEEATAVLKLARGES